MTPSARQQALSQIEANERSAEFAAMLMIVGAIENGSIDKRNREKLDSKINANISKFVREQAPQYSYSLQERIQTLARGSRKLRNLPPPTSDFLSARQNSKVLKEDQEPRDLKLWLSLAIEERDEDRKRTHDFLFFGTSCTYDECVNLPSPQESNSDLQKPSSLPERETQCSN